RPRGSPLFPYTTLFRSGAGGALELAARDGRGLGPFDCVLWAVGRMAAVEDLALAKAGVALDIQGFIATDTYQASSAPGIYAIGRSEEHTSELQSLRHLV